MAIYRAMLEDSINDLDTNNDGAKETKELMDVIDKQEINAQEVEDAQDAEFGPDDVDDILDETVIAIAESYTGYYAIIESLAIAELHEAARSNERGEVRGGRVSEEFDKNTKKGVISAMKQRLAALCTRIISSINKLLTALKRVFFDNHALYAELAGKKILKGGSRGMLEVKGYPYDGLDKALKGFNKDMVTSSVVYKKVNSGKAVSDSDIAGDYSRIFGGIMDVGNAESPRTYKKALIQALRGADKPVMVKMSAEDVLKILKNSKADYQLISNTAKLIKSEFKSAIKAIDSWASRGGEARGNAREGDARGGESGLSANAVAKAMNRYIDFVAAARAAIVKASADRARQARKLAHKYWRAGLGKDVDVRGREARGAEMRESAIENSFKYGYLSNLNLI